jgi:hypothetical protein
MELLSLSGKHFTKQCFVILAIFLLACQAGDVKNYTEKKAPALQLNKFSPVPGEYIYDIISDTKTVLEINGKETENTNRTEIGLKYNISKDSSGNIVLALTYDKVKMRLKNGETESTMDAADAGTSIDPVEKMLGFLTSAKISTTIDPSGKVILDAKGPFVVGFIG